MNRHKAIDMYQEHNTRIFNPNKFFSREDIDAAFLHESNLFNSIEDGISILSPDLSIMRVNFTMSKWYTHKPRLVGEKCYAAYHDRSAPCDQCPIIQAIESRNAHRDIVSYYMKESHASGWHELQGFPIMDGDTLVGIVEYVKDITCEVDLYSKISAIEKDMAQVKSQNILLRDYIEQKEQEKRELEDTIRGNVKKYIRPVLRQMRESLAEKPAEADMLAFLDSLFDNIVTPYLSGPSNMADFTSREIEIMAMIRAGSTSKEIADALCLSKKTVDFHRANIRAKMHLISGRDNLRACLMRSSFPLD
jgi:DNA-binding CsgD family transcriptional regulator